MLDLDTGRPLATTNADEHVLKEHAWIRATGSGEFSMPLGPLWANNLALLPVANESWETATASGVVGNAMLARTEISELIELSTNAMNSETFAFRTKQGRHGLLQIIGTSQEARGVKIRFKLVQEINSARTEPALRFDQNIVEDLALQMLVLIREKDDAKLKLLATDSVKAGWRDALPQFALEMRERFLQMTGKQFTMFPAESLVESNRAVVKCTGPKELNGIYLVLFFVKTDEGWRNWTLRNSPPGTPLSEYLKNKPPHK